MKLVWIAAVSLLVIAGLSGCAAQAPAIRLAGGTTSCVPNPSAKPGIMAVAFHNTTGGTITVTKGTVSGANVATTGAWILDATSRKREEVGYGLQPFSDLPDWATRQKVGSVTVGNGKWASMAVAFQFAGGSVEGSEVDGITMKYRAANGATGTATSSAVGSYSAQC